MTGFLTCLALLLAANAWCTRRVLAEQAFLPNPRMLVAALWLFPGVGLVLAWLQLRGLAVHRHLADHGAPEGPADGAVAPADVEAGGSSFPLAAHLHDVGGLPMVDWAAVASWADAGDAPVQAADAVRRAWLLHLRDALGDGHWVHESPQALILSPLGRGEAEATARYIATARQRVARVLGELARFPDGERSVVVVFDDEATYYHYVSAFQGEGGDFSFSGGMFIDAGCPHFVTVRADLSMLEPVIAHELTHAALAHLQLPLWLDEGLAVNTERRVATVPPPRHTPRELDAMHRCFWGDAEIQQFWTGASFQRPDDGNLLSYELARILVEQFSRDNWAPFARFVAEADRDDAGAAAARDHLGVDLGAAAAALLGRDTATAWSPRPATA